MPCSLQVLDVSYSGITEKGLRMVGTGLETHFVRLREVRSEVVCAGLVEQMYRRQWTKKI